MEVTKDNFNEVFKVLEKSIYNADFISIDGEFTGLSTIKGGGMTYETLEERYYKLKKGSNKFLLVQYGVCLFTWNSNDNRYEACPYTFYIFPRPYKRFHNDVFFMCQSSSLDFLANNKFDFNKLFHHGISFMSPWKEADARGRLNKELSFLSNNLSKKISANSSMVDNGENKSTVFIPKDQREFLEKVTKDVDDFMRNSSLKNIDLPPCSAFQRKLIYETLEERYPVGLYLQSFMNEEQQKIIRGVKISSKEETINKKTKEEQDILEEIIGFTRVIQLLSKCCKPIIGHNMLMDIFLTTVNFFALSPDDLTEFKALVKSVFGSMYDTKVLCNVQPLSSKISGTSLSKLKYHVDNRDLPDSKVVIMSDQVDGYVDTKADFHQAGYDAYCTGIIFISLVKSLFESVMVKSERIDFSSDILKPFRNKIHVMGIRDIQYLDTDKPSVTPSRLGVFYVRHPKGWSSKDLADVFSPFCTILGYTVRLSDCESYITLSDDTKYNVVMENLVSKINSVIYVLPYSDYVSKIRITRMDDTKTLKRIYPEEVDKGNQNEFANSNIKPAKRKRTSSAEDGEISEDELGSEEKLFELPSKW